MLLLLVVVVAAVAAVAVVVVAAAAAAVAAVAVVVGVAVVVAVVAVVRVGVVRCRLCFVSGFVFVRVRAVLCLLLLLPRVPCIRPWLLLLVVGVVHSMLLLVLLD